MAQLSTRSELVAAAENLKHCLEAKADEDAFQWALDIVSGIHEMAKQRAAAVTNWLSECRRRADSVGD